MKMQKLQKLIKDRRIILGLLALVLVVGTAIGVQHYRNDKYIKDTKAALEAEESNEAQFTPTTPTTADTYVNDFKYVSNVTIGKDGFSPATVVVKPRTKVIFTGGDEKPHFVALAPGSPSPRYFDPQIDVTQNSVFQTKFETAGTYSFYDRYNPTFSFVVVVADK